MELQNVLHIRQSVREYTAEKVSFADIEYILSAGQKAPVGMHNYEGYLLTVITDETVLEGMKRSCAQRSGKSTDPIYGAPLFILVSSGPKALEGVKEFDGGCIVENMHLAASDLGLGSVFILGMIRQIQKDREVAKQLELPEGYTPLCGLAVGHAVHDLAVKGDTEHMPVCRLV